MNVEERLYLLIFQNNEAYEKVKIKSSADVKLTDLGYDSLAFIRLIVDIENEFGISWPDECLNAEDSIVVGDVLRKLEKLLDEKEMMGMNK